MITFYFKEDKLIFLKDVNNMKISKSDDEWFKIEFEPTAEDLLNFFHAGGNYAISQYSKIFDNIKSKK
jgi:hypothetical protein